MVTWTKEQEEAIYAKGSDILVSAAAGSGKTAVLVERIIQKLLSKEEIIDIDSLLVVTFTNAAAQEMKSRVGEALEKAFVNDPTSNHLKKQLSLLQRASISTLHSFCMEIIRQHAYLLDLDPPFRMTSDMEADLLKQDVLDELFEEWYGAENEQQEEFFAIVDRFSNDRNDEAVETLILNLYTFAMQNPWPDEWLDDVVKIYDIKEEWQEEELLWLQKIKQDVHDQLDSIEAEIKLAIKLTKESDGPYHYYDALEDDQKNVHQALALLNSWDELQAFMIKSSFKRLSGKRVECNEDKKEQVKEIRKRYQDIWKELKTRVFSRHLNAHIADMRELHPIIRHLIKLVKQFKERFTEKKRKEALVDYSDLEHLSLEILLDDSATPDNLIPSQVARQLQDRYTEVLVDEYQDINHVQETILQLVSEKEGPGNMFMVGDVKQSIYRFRHAEPKLFIDKYKRFEKDRSDGLRIDLANNFRSRENVLIGANYIFRQILDEELGEITYDKQAELIYANRMYDSFPSKSPESELIIIDREAQEELTNSNQSENYQELENVQLEARTYAKKIKEWFGENNNPPLQVIDKGTQRPRDVQYRDIVILLRSLKEAPTIVDELKKQGIPVYAELSTGYFAAIEIKVMLAFLKIIDNPYQDIPLASVLRSPIVGLNEEELVRIRQTGKRKPFYEAVRQYEKQHANETAIKIGHFLKQLTNFRRVAREGALSELVWLIYRETGYYDFVGGIPGGRQRQANLRALYDRARGYETTSFRGLYRFLRFIERMEERGDDLGAARALSEQEDVVRIMTIHSSKGLEFPVVILGGMAREFYFQDLNQKYLIDKDLGFTSKFIDPVKRITFPTLYHYLVRREMQKKMLAEEMRVLYVALTRAKEKLVMIANVNSFTKSQKKWLQLIDHPTWVLPTQNRFTAKSYIDWVAPALIRHRQTGLLREDEEVPATVLQSIRTDESNWKISVIHGSQLTDLKRDDLATNVQLKDAITSWHSLPLEDSELMKDVRRKLSFTYPYKMATIKRAKQSVSELKRQKELTDEYGGTEFLKAYRAPIVRRPNFMQKEKMLSAAEIGTAMHAVMQHLPLTKPLQETEIKTYVEQFIHREILTEEEAESIDAKAIEQFFTTDLAKLIIENEPVQREVPFSFSLPANEVYQSFSDGSNEFVLIQGVIDCLIPKGDGWIILDYKTDKITDETVTNKTKNILVNRYMTQMNFYKQAVEAILKQPVKAAYLYFFDKQVTIKL